MHVCMHVHMKAGSQCQVSSLASLYLSFQGSLAKLVAHWLVLLAGQ